MIDIVRRAATQVGGVPALAERLGVTRQALYQWRRIPAEKVPQVAQETGLPVHELRPDIYERPATSVIASYEKDVTAWSFEQSAFLRAGDLGKLDLENLAEEIESLGRSNRAEIRSRMGVLLVHLLKMAYQPAKRSNSWRSTVLEQRSRIADVIDDSPSLARYPASIAAREYAVSRKLASLDTDLPIEHFPEACPFAIEDILDPDFEPPAAF